MSDPLRQPVVLVVIDGFGVAPPSRGNAVTLAKTPTLDRLIEEYPAVTLQASGDAVGLAWGEMGNSEVGHVTIGAGKVIYQDLPRITRSIVDGSFFKNPAFTQALATVKKHRSRLHLVGMFSSAGVHSFDEHAYALLELCAQQKVTDVVVHAILDGRDSAYNSGLEFIRKLEKKLTIIGVGTIATVMGRALAMDRDSHWDRTGKAYLAIARGQGPTASSALDAVQAAYANGVYDEQLEPTVVMKNGKPVATVNNQDAVIFFNFRSDRARQLTKAFVLPGFAKFERPEYLKDLTFVAMTEYEKNLPVSVAFPPEQVTEPLAQVISRAGLHQLHLAETEKYAHVTFFFNGGIEQPFPNEERILVPSPSVANYDQKPEMSARQLTERLIEQLNTGKYAFSVINFANPDMIGHTGNIPATIKAVETVDWCLGEIVEAVLSINGVVMITADHGNAEAKIDPQTGGINKEHTANPVPLIVAGNNLPAIARQRYHAPLRDLSSLTPVGVLADIAPTLLGLMGLPIPSAMTGHNIFSERS